MTGDASPRACFTRAPRAKAVSGIQIQSSSLEPRLSGGLFAKRAERIDQHLAPNDAAPCVPVFAADGTAHHAERAMSELIGAVSRQRLACPLEPSFRHQRLAAGIG